MSATVAEIEGLPSGDMDMGTTRLGHYYCKGCHPVLAPGIQARCGTRLLGLKGRFPDQCVVCLDMSFHVCPKCGAL